MWFFKNVRKGSKAHDGTIQIIYISNPDYSLEYLWRFILNKPSYYDMEKVLTKIV